MQQHSVTKNFSNSTSISIFQQCIPCARMLGIIILSRLVAKALILLQHIPLSQGMSSLSPHTSRHRAHRLDPIKALAPVHISWPCMLVHQRACISRVFPHVAPCVCSNHKLAVNLLVVSPLIDIKSLHQKASRFQHSPSS